MRGHAVATFLIRSKLCRELWLSVGKSAHDQIAPQQKVESSSEHEQLRTAASLINLCHLLQGLLLTTYLKFLIADPEDASLRALAEEVFDRYSRCVPCWACSPSHSRCSAGRNPHPFPEGGQQPNDRPKRTSPSSALMGLA